MDGHREEEARFWEALPALESPVRPARDARAGVLYAFELLVDGRGLRFGYRDGRILPAQVAPVGTAGTSTPGEISARDVLCAPELAAWARRSGWSCGELPVEVVQARALLAFHLASAPQLRSEIDPLTMARVLDAAALLQRVAPGEEGLRLRSRLPGGRACEVVLVGFPCGCAMLSIHVGRPRARGRLPDGDVLMLNIGETPAYAVEAVRAAGWPALAIPSALRHGRPARIDEHEVLLLIDMVRLIAHERTRTPRGKEVH